MCGSVRVTFTFLHFVVVVCLFFYWKEDMSEQQREVWCAALCQSHCREVQLLLEMSAQFSLISCGV